MKLRPLVVIALAAMAAASGCSDGVSPAGAHWVVGVDTTVLIGDVDFTHGGSRPPEAPAPTVQRGPFELRASAVAVRSGGGPMSIDVRVTATNRADTTAVITVRGCTVRPELYDAATRVGPPAWEWSGICMQGNYTRDVAPGDSTVFHSTVNEVMLGSIPDGRYYATASFGMGGEEIRLHGGHVDLLLAVPGLAFQIATRPIGSVVRASVSVENRGQDRVHLEYGVPAMTLALYEDAEMERRVRHWYWTDSWPDILAVRWVEPGSTLEDEWFNADFQIADARGGLPSGTYALGVEMRLNWRVYRLPAGRVTVP